MQALLESQQKIALTPILTAGTAPAARPEPLQLHLWRVGDPQRLAAEDFIRERFQASYEAEVCVFHPYLLGVTRGAGNITSVIGFRTAHSGRFFLESYLDGAVERLLTDATGESVQRGQIVEVGNLASVDTDSFRFLLTGLITLLEQMPGTRWMVCTVGEKLIRLLQRTRFFPLVIKEASADRLTPAEGSWGSYYRHTRSVVAGNVSYGMRELKRQNIWRPEFASHARVILDQLGVCP